MKKIFFALMLLAGAPAWAQSGTPAIDFSQPILDEKGFPVVEGQDKTPLTLRLVAVRSLAALFEDEKGLTGETKVRRGDLAIRIMNSQAPLLLSPEDLTMIKQVIGKAYSPLVVARAWPMLDPSLAGTK